MTRPSDGVLVNFSASGVEHDGFSVYYVLRPSEVRPGDIVVAVDGRSMESWSHGFFGASAPPPNWQRGQSHTYTIWRNGQLIEVPVTFGSYPVGAVLRMGGWTFTTFALMLALIASYIFVRRPRERLTAPLLLFAVGELALIPDSFIFQVSEIDSPLAFWLFNALSFGVYTLILSASLHAALLFPRPHAFTLRRRWLIPTVYLAPVLSLLIPIALTRRSTSSTLAWVGEWWQVSLLLSLSWAVLMVVTLQFIYRSSRDVADRQKIRWVVFACVLILVGETVLAFIPILTNRQLLTDSLRNDILGLLDLTLPAALAIAILRYRLFDIDVIINRTLVYGALTAIIVGMYVLIVGVLGVLFQTRGDLFISLLATGLVAIAFQPLRAWLQRVVNRLFYGWRDEPYAVLTRLGRRLETTLAQDTVLATIAEAVANALLLPYVAISVQHQSAAGVAAAYGTVTETPLRLPLIYQAEPVGELLLAPRSPGESFTANDRRLLRDLAHQAGIAVHAVGLAEELQALTADLQRSRERLVTTREEERRRLRRDLHDGLGPSLAALVLKAGSARALYPRDPKAADALLVGLETDLNGVVGEIRRLVYNLRPPALDELGLVAAIRACAADYGGRRATRHATEGTENEDDGEDTGLAIIVEASDALPALPAAVEVAAYRIAQEALTNVVRHARASMCRVRLSLGDGLLEVEVHDDGVGIGPERQAGVGLASMLERAAELGGTCLIEARPGGGTWVLARLPLPPKKQEKQES
jgi:signal transduction histidine kinase